MLLPVVFATPAERPKNELLLPVFTVQLVVRDFPPLEGEVMGGIAERYAVLGRDVLNRFKVVLDGPNQKVEISG